MSALPIPGQDDGTWGDILNDYLLQSHNADGTLKTAAVATAAPVTSVNTLTGDVVVDLANLGDVNTAGVASTNVLTYNGTQWVPGTVSSSGSTPDASNGVKGLIALDTDLGGTAALPQVVSTHLSSALPLGQGGTGSTTQNFVDLTTGQSVGGIKTFTSSPIVPTPTTSTQVANKSYVDGAVTSSGVQVGGDLGGSASSPQVVSTHLAAALPVAQGGTGAASLTGILKGNGTSAVTAVSTIPVANGGTGAATLTGIIKGSGTSALTAAVPGTDYLPPAGSGAALTGITGSQITGDITGNAANVNGVVAIANGGTGNTSGKALVDVAEAGTTAGTRGKVNFVPGTNVSISAVDNAGSGQVDVTISATGSGGAADATSSTNGIVRLDGDFGGTAATPQVVATHLSAALPVNQGGTGSITQNFVDLTTGQSVGGIKTFTSSPIVPTPTTSTQVANKSYVDGVAGAGASNATNSTPGLIQLTNNFGGTATLPQVVATNLSSPLPTSQGGTGSITQNFVDLTNNQSIVGVKAFTNSPTVPTPTTSTQVANKSYVDSVATTGDMDSSVYDPAGITEQVVGIDAAQTLTSKTINGSNNTITNVSLTTAVTGTLPITHGGTGAVTQAAAATAVLPSQTSNSGDYLTTNGTTVAWGSLTGVAALATNGGVETLASLGTVTGTVNIDLTTGNLFNVTMGGSVTFTFSTPINNTACSFGMYLRQDGTGGRAVTWPTSVKWSGGVIPTASTSANAVDLYVFESINGGLSWYSSQVGAAFAVPA